MEPDNWFFNSFDVLSHPGKYLFVLERGVQLDQVVLQLLIGLDFFLCFFKRDEKPPSKAFFSFIFLLFFGTLFFLLLVCLLMRVTIFIEFER